MDYSLDFEFNGIHSSTFGVYKITMDSGMLTEDYFLANKTLNGYRLKGDDQFNLTSVDREPLVIPLVLWLNGNVGFEKEQRIKEWLDTDDFCKLRFGDQTFYYNAMTQGTPSFKHDSMGDGYVEFQFMTDSPYRHSNEIVVKGKVEDVKNISLLNDGAKKLYPIIKLTIPGTTNGIEIRNKTTKESCLIEGIYSDLVLELLSKEEELNIESNIIDIYSQHNGQFISLRKGRNDIEIKGSFYYEIIYKNRYL